MGLGVDRVLGGDGEFSPRRYRPKQDERIPSYHPGRR